MKRVLVLALTESAYRGHESASPGHGSVKDRKKSVGVEALNGNRGSVSVPSNRVISSLEGKFGTVGESFVPVIECFFMKISNLCKNQL
jgi:hypothetical protein